MWCCVLGSKQVTAAIAFLLALFSHILNHVVIRLHNALYEKENPNKLLHHQQEEATGTKHKHYMKQSCLSFNTSESMNNVQNMLVTWYTLNTNAEKKFRKCSVNWNTVKSGILYAWFFSQNFFKSRGAYNLLELISSPFFQPKFSPALWTDFTCWHRIPPS